MRQKHTHLEVINPPYQLTYINLEDIMKEPLLSNSTQNDEIGKMERAINEGFAESEKDLKDKKTPLDQPTQNDWVGRFDKKFSNGGKGGQWDGYWEDIDMFISTVKIEDVKDFIRKELADARREVIQRVMSVLPLGDDPRYRELKDVLAALKEEIL